MDVEARQPGPSSPRHRLFYAQANPSYTLAELQAEFEAFGPVFSLRMIEDKATNTSSGCGYVEYEDASHAQAAVNSLHGGSRLAAPGCRFAVAFAMLERSDTADAGAEQLAGDGSSEASKAGATTADDPAELERRARTVYFARVPPCVPVDELEFLFASCGELVGVNLFKPWATSKTSKGCGLVEYKTAEGAQRALSTLNNFSYWPNAPYPLLVEQALPDALKPPKQVKPPRQASAKAAQQGNKGGGKGSSASPAERVRQQLLAGKAASVAASAAWGQGLAAAVGAAGCMAGARHLLHPALGPLMRVAQQRGVATPDLLASPGGLAGGNVQLMYQPPMGGASPLASDLLLQQLGITNGVSAPGMASAVGQDVTPYDRLATATGGWGNDIPVQVAPLVHAQQANRMMPTVTLPGGWGPQEEPLQFSAGSNLSLSGPHAMAKSGSTLGSGTEDLMSSNYSNLSTPPGLGMHSRGGPQQMLQQQRAAVGGGAGPQQLHLMHQNIGHSQGQLMGMMGMSAGQHMLPLMASSAGGGGGGGRPLLHHPGEAGPAAQHMKLLLSADDVAVLSGHLGALSAVTGVAASIQAQPGEGGLALVLSGGPDQLNAAHGLISLMRAVPGA